MGNLNTTFPITETKPNANPNANPNPNPTHPAKSYKP